MKSVFFSEDHDAFRATVRQFIEKEVAPHAEEWEQEEQIPRRIWRLMAASNLLGINYPLEWGGMNGDFFYSVVFLEELARSAMGGFAAAVGAHQYMALSYINKFASRFLKEKYLRPGIAGEKIGALAITEPDSGSDVAALRTQAVRKGDHYLLSGSKTFITNGMYGDFMVLAAKTNPETGEEGISLFVTDAGLPGIYARKLKKIGWHSSDTAEISLDQVKVPATHLIGKENKGFYYITECFQAERLTAAVTAVAGADYCLEITLKYLQEREAFNSPLAKFQALRHNLCDLATELEAARQLTYHACWLFKQGAPAVQQCSMAKLYATELAKKIADACLQYFGGYGYMDDYPVSRIYRDARAGTIVGGTSEIMRESIAKQLIDNTEHQPLESPGEQGENGVMTPQEKPAKSAPAEKTAETTTVSGGDFFREVVQEAPKPIETYEAESDEAALAEEIDLGELPESLMEEEIDSLTTSLADEKEAPLSVENAAERDSEPDPSRPQTIVDKIIYSLPERFRPEKAAGYRALFHFKISGKEGGEYTVAVAGGECRVKSGLLGQPKCLVEASVKTYIDMETGKTNPQIAFMMGKVKISNIPEMMQFIKMFRKFPDT